MPYLTRDQMQAAWDKLVTDFPSICSSEVLGYSVQNRPIKLYKIGNPQGGSLAIISNIQGEEKASVEIPLLFAQWVCSSVDADAVRIRERNLLLIVPMVCVDTYDVRSSNANGSNLYFNFDFDFGPNGGSSICRGADYKDTPITDQAACLAIGGTWMPWNYRGPSALSEPESRIVKNFFSDWMPKIEISLHDGQSGNYLWYVNGIDAADLTKVQAMYQKYLARAAGAPGVPFVLSANNYGGGRPEPCAYFHNNKQIQALIVECCTHDPAYDTIPTTEYPKSKALLVTLAQEVEVVPPITHTLAVLSTVGGSTNPVPGFYVILEGETASVDAQPNTGYLLDHWELDGANVGTNDPFNIVMNAPHTLKAIFAQVSPSTPVQHVIEDRIFDENEKEVMWRGAGGSYLFHAGDQYQQAWINHLSSIQKMGLNTMRLAFKFTWDTLGDATADDLDFEKMDWVISWLASHGVKSIIDYHGSQAQMWGKDGVSSDTINPLLVQGWQEIAAHYKGNANVIAYEIYNEPSRAWGSSYRSTPRKNAEGYNILTNAIRLIDPDHICIWETPEYYIAPFNEITDLMLPNVVYTAHRWWTNLMWQLQIWGVQRTAYNVIEKFLGWRKNYMVPIWLGEFGLGGGGNSDWDPTQLEDLVCQELLNLCEQQVIHWNLWMGAMAITKRWYVEDIFPLPFINTDCIRQPWNNLYVLPDLRDYVAASSHIDKFSESSIEMWHNKDFVELKPGIVIHFTRSHTLPDSTVEKVEDRNIDVTELMTFTNYEGTTDYPGNWNILIYIVSSLPTTERPVPRFPWLAAVLKNVRARFGLPGTMLPRLFQIKGF